jgi:hypothetical protein
MLLPRRDGKRQRLDDTVEVCEQSSLKNCL